jgi:hypothetical protein
MIEQSQNQFQQLEQNTKKQLNALQQRYDDHYACHEPRYHHVFLYSKRETEYLHQQDLKSNEIKELKLKLDELNEKVNLLQEHSQLNNRYNQVDPEPSIWSINGSTSNSNRIPSAQPAHVQNKQVMQQIMQIQMQQQHKFQNNGQRLCLKTTNNTNNQYDQSSDISNDSHESSDNSIEMGKLWICFLSLF